ncbi:MAG TPA: murein biosynthesis integral membrane protein MurJ, partial [Pseudomonadales bacterium]|nr:murein biosynthesis integral membrane protein MurJ [Pseudomonadales bacterium]
FGVGWQTDAFVAAFKIPNFLRRLFAEGAFSQAFVPILSEYRKTKSHEEVRQLVDRTFGSLSLVLLIITVLAILGAPYVVKIFAPGFASSAEQFELASHMLKIMFPYLLLISMVAFTSSLLNSYGSFGVPAFTPTFLNIVQISAALWATHWFEPPILALAWGVLIAGVVQILYQLPFLYQRNLLPRPKLDFKHEGVRRILKLMGPAVLGVSVGQISLLVDSILASFLPHGSVTWLYYADRLLELPMGLFGVAIGTVILPKLSSQHAEKSFEKFQDTLDWAIRSMLMIGLAAGTAMVILGDTLVTVLFQYGKFTAEDVAKAGAAVKAYSPGVVGFLLVKVLAPGYYARQITKTPVKFATIALFVAMATKAALALPLQHVGLAIGTTVGALLNVMMLGWGLWHSGVYHLSRESKFFFLKLIVANSLMGGLLYYTNSTVDVWIARSIIERVMYLSAVIGGGVAVYFGSLFLMGVRARDLRR